MSHHAEIFSVLNTGNIGPSFDLLIGSISSYYLIQTLMLEAVLARLNKNV